MSAKKKDTDRYREIRNTKLRYKYFVEETFETGIILKGTEVKSIRMGQAQINDAFCRIEKGKIILYHAHIAEYAFGNVQNHEPYRPRELLMHKREINRLALEIQSGNRVLVPTRIYFKKALIKVEIALCTGKKQHDKREDMKKKAAMREADRELKNIARG